MKKKNQQTLPRTSHTKSKKRHAEVELEKALQKSRRSKHLSSERIVTPGESSSRIRKNKGEVVVTTRERSTGIKKSLLKVKGPPKEKSVEIENGVSSAYEHENNEDHKVLENMTEVTTHAAGRGAHFRALFVLRGRVFTRNSGEDISILLEKIGLQGWSNLFLPREEKRKMAKEQKSILNSPKGTGINGDSSSGDEDDGTDEDNQSLIFKEDSNTK
ncbi:hypothetical protein K7X08_010476 [Anisodus acutangulus]|uniref:Uncharacterized protein n=1 Tax=Anisodus acutangulus TaxID=402998 RepID=A0A9Q1RRS1_9SOLA|nr:hypothetical protein K7X08_010476 [Anisodus acutangulus]